MQEVLHSRSDRAPVELLLIAVTSPILAAIYKDGECIESYRREGKCSEVLPPLLHDILYNYRVEAVYYANGPGSFMAIKIAYVMAKTVSSALDIPLYATDAFAFNGGRPIKAIGRSCFVKKEGSIRIEPDCSEEAAPFYAPKRLDRSIFCERSEPLYVLPAV